MNIFYGKSLVVDDVSFDLKEGGYLAIVGPNGAGKSTLLRTIFGMHPSLTGKILIDGKSISAYSSRELAMLVAYVPQLDNRDIPFTIREFLDMARFPYRGIFSAPSLEDRTMIDQVVVMFDLGDLLNRSLKTLSGGERQKVFVAAAVAQGSAILLLDEPTSFLDPKHQLDIFRMLKEIRSHFNRTILLVSHDINRAALYADTILALKLGRTFFHGPSIDLVDPSILSGLFDMEFTFCDHPTISRRITVPEHL